MTQSAISRAGPRRRPLRWVAVIIGAALALFLVLNVLSFAADESGTLVTASGRHAITLELADTAQEREIGLMNRQSMPDDHGMLFDFEEGREVTMWMKNTYIPLDMVFMDRNGVVTHVAANAKPLSLDLISSQGEVWYVLELNGGAASRLGLKRGDRLENRSIAPSK